MQARYWKNSEALFRHATEVTKDNGIMASNLGEILLRQGRAAEALPYLRQAAAFAPDLPFVHDDLGNAFLATGEVVAWHWISLKSASILTPNDASAQPSLRGHSSAKRPGGPDAIPHLQKALQPRPGDAQVNIAAARRALELAGPATNSPAAIALRRQIAFSQNNSRITNP